MGRFLLLAFLFFLSSHETPAFFGFPLFVQRRSSYSRCAAPSHGSALSMSGRGVAAHYTWQEEAFEIDVSVQVPKKTRTKDILFRATTKSIDLRLKQADGTEQILLDKTRKLRGRINVDGTYWVISDAVDDDSRREVTVTIEKLIKTPHDDFEVVEYDWKGVYSNDTAEVSSRVYDKPEVLDVREYAAGLGVDIDNINMSMVDKTMFSSGLNLTQSSLDELAKAGYMKEEEITRQADGTEYTTNGDNGPELFSPFGKSVGQDEIKEAIQMESSPWQSAVPVRFDKESNRTYMQQVRNLTRAAFAQDAQESALAALDEKKNAVLVNDAPIDPIDTLTVSRLKEILKSQGLKVTGSKKELKDRLRRQVNSILQGNQQDPPGVR